MTEPEVQVVNLQDDDSVMRLGGNLAQDFMDQLGPLIHRLDDRRRVLFFAGLLAPIGGTMAVVIGVPAADYILEQQRNLTLLSEPMPGRVPS